MQQILLVEDESAIADAVVYALQTEGFKVTWIPLGQEALSQLQRANDYALLILDVGLPDTSGFELCKEIRRFSDVPIIFLTARNEEIDRIVGLEIGADDYVTKPFSPRELSARVKVILKRMQPPPAGNTTGTFHIDHARAQISYLGQPLDLTRYEFLILKKLLSQPERVFSREQIINDAWDEPHASLERAVDTHIKTLRQKLRQVEPASDPSSDPVKTHRGLGYSVSGQVSES